MSKSVQRHSADHFLLLLIVGLTILGFLTVASASSVVAAQFQDDAYFFLKHQMLYGGSVGFVVFLIGYFVPYRFWRVFALPGLLFSIVLLALVFVPGLQVNSGGASRWVGIGSFSIQPTEIVKLTFILYLAALFDKKGDDVRDWRQSVMPFLVISGIIVVLIILQPDLGTLISIGLIAGAMIFVGGFRLSHLALIGLGGLSLVAVFLNTASYRLERIMVYLHPELDPQGIGYQINQALLAVGTGGLWGLGLGRSRQKYHYLPEPAGDSIFAVMAEELGLVRVIFVLLVFALLGWRGYVVARAAPDMFGRLLATGITSWILVQTFMNVASILGIMPLTGIPLPFISYGGSALATLLFASGVLLNVSQYTK